MGVGIGLLCGFAHADGQDQEERTVNSEAAAKHANRLINATSPYLLQHAHNPVDWYEWGAEAFAKAKEQDKPVFLSIGYAACHWCHVMEHECFEKEDLAAILNAHFVSIKVDREERPDVDEIYMQVTQAMNNGQGGWPMSVFITPDKVPFFAGTYFPPDRFATLLTAIAEAWKNDRTQIVTTTEQVTDYLEKWAAGAPATQTAVGREVVSRTAGMLAEAFDPLLGGLRSGGNKFPPSMAMELMLREYIRTEDIRLLEPVKLTLDRMAAGGIYDHLGGGICRYSTDPAWLVPHFEKMLYDQALVSGIYLDGYQVTGVRRCADVAADIFDYVIADLQSPEGGFYSTRDADSEGMEGKFYVWTVEQVEEVLGKDDARVFCAYYDVTPGGNWQDSMGHAPPGPKNILNIKRPAADVASELGISVEELERRLDGMRGKLLEARSKRVPPGLDDKVLSGWNGLMIASLARGARVLDEPKYAHAAARAADFVLSRMRRDGRLLGTYRNGTARLTGYLTDYAFMIEGLLNLYEATFDLRFLDEAEALNKTLIERYHDHEAGGFFFTADDAEEMLVRSKNPRDGAIPSGNSVQAMNLLRLAILLDNKNYRDKADGIFRAFGAMIEESPWAFERLLSAVDFANAEVREIALIGDAADPGMKELVRTVYRHYLPNKVVAHAGGLPEDPAAERLPLLRLKTPMQGKPTAYVCERFVCRLPVTDPEALAGQF